MIKNIIKREIALMKCEIKPTEKESNLFMLFAVLYIFIAGFFMYWSLQSLFNNGYYTLTIIFTYIESIVVILIAWWISLHILKN